MSKILGVNLSHNVSVCLLENGKIKSFKHEERFSKHKNMRAEIDVNNNFITLNKFINENIDIVGYNTVDYSQEINPTELVANVHKKIKHLKFYHDKKKHHIYHALTGFYFSPFKEAMCIVVDGGGARPTSWPFQEIETIMYVNKNNYIEYFKHCSNMPDLPVEHNVFHYSDQEVLRTINGVQYLFSSNSPGGIAFNKGSELMGFVYGEAGKLMGLSSYQYTNKKFNLNYDHVKLAAEIQEENYKRTCQLIEQAVSYKGIKNIILSGGVALNCVNNFKYVQKFKDINFFIDPVPHDAGTAIGVALYCYAYR
jgi:carbamoyltransferase